MIPETKSSLSIHAEVEALRKQLAHTPEAFRALGFKYVTRTPDGTVIVVCLETGRSASGINFPAAHAAFLEAHAC